MSALNELDARRILPRVLPLALGLGVLAGMTFAGKGLGGQAAAGLEALAGLLLLAVAAGIHAPFGAGSLGLAAAAVPPLIVFYGPVVAAGGAAAVFTADRLGRRATTVRAVREASRIWIAGTLSGVGRVVLSALGAALVWGPAFEASGGRHLAAAAAAMAVYAVLAAAMRLAESVAAVETHPLRRALPPLTLDLAGWALGAVLVKVVLAAGWAPAHLLFAGLAALSLEAARNRWLRDAARLKVRELRELTLAGHRIIFRNPDLHAIAEQIHFECGRVLSFAWFQFELLRSKTGPRSWFAGPDHKVRDGRPSPPPSPPVLPGIHRRARWKLVVRELATDDEVLAVLRFWCDPRQAEAGALELLDALLPQMGSSVQRALLDREAKRDPLTDLPDRRALENRMQDAFAACVAGGGSMAIIMCDVDNFKRINDRYGHTAGDRVVVEVAHLLEAHRREEDLCCRYGGDEFSLVLERADGETALAIAERLRAAVAAHPAKEFKSRIPVRLTAGVAAFPELQVRSAAELLQLADEALYEAKRRGRNRCLLHAGRGRFRTPEGESLGDRQQPAPEPPTLFA